MGFCTTLPPSFFSLASSAPKHTHRESRRKENNSLKGNVYFNVYYYKHFNNKIKSFFSLAHLFQLINDKHVFCMFTDTLDHLQKEYQEMEGSMSAHKGKEENRTDLEQSRPS